jgi:hypothetical protein
MKDLLVLIAVMVRTILVRVLWKSCRNGNSRRSRQLRHHREERPYEEGDPNAEEERSFIAYSWESWTAIFSGKLTQAKATQLHIVVRKPSHHNCAT